MTNDEYRRIKALAKWTDFHLEPDLDDARAGGVWDYSGEVSDILTRTDMQSDIYTVIREVVSALDSKGKKNKWFLTSSTRRFKRVLSLNVKFQQKAKQTPCALR